MKSVAVCFSLVMLLSACTHSKSEEAGSGSGKPIDIPLAPPPDWIAAETTGFRFFHPDPNHAGSVKLIGPGNATDVRGGKVFSLPNYFVRLNTSHNESVYWVTEGAEYANANCASLVQGHHKIALNRQLDVYYVTASFESSGKIHPMHNFLVSGPQNNCLALYFRDASLAGVNWDISLDDNSEVAKFIVGVVASVQSLSGNLEAAQRE